MLQDRIKMYDRELDELTHDIEKRNSIIEMLQERQREAIHKAELLQELVDIERKELAKQDAVRVVALFPAEWNSCPYEAAYTNEYGVKFNDTLAREIRELYATGKWGTYPLSWKYEVSAGEIHHILTGKRWADAGGPLFEKPKSVV